MRSLSRQKLQLGEETRGRNLWRPRLPGRSAIDRDKRVLAERFEGNAQDIVHFFFGPADDADRFGCSCNPVGFLVEPVLGFAPARQAVAQRNCFLELVDELAIGLAKEGLEDRNAVETEQALVRIMQELAQLRARIGLGKTLPAQLQHEKRMLRNRERQGPGGMAAPTISAGKAEGEILVLPVERRGIEKVEPLARKEPNPGARLDHLAVLCVARRASLAQASCRQQGTTWSLTMPTAWQKA